MQTPAANNHERAAAPRSSGAWPRRRRAACAAACSHREKQRYLIGISLCRYTSQGPRLHQQPSEAFRLRPVGPQAAPGQEVTYAAGLYTHTASAA